MSQFNLRTKFEQIALNWKISKHEIYNFNQYINVLSNYKLCILNKKNADFNLNSISNSLVQLLDVIFTTNYIESNYQDFSSTLDKKEVHQLKESGFNNLDFFSPTNYLHKYKKDLIFRIDKFSPSITKKKVIRLNFSFLDKKYHWWQKDALTYNISSLINALDKQNFIWSNLDIKYQSDSHDKLLATLNLDIDPQRLCEDSVLWMSNSAWAPFIPDVQKQIYEFCKANNYDYHSSYYLSIKDINNALKNINFHINDNFVTIYHTFIQIRDTITNRKISKEDIFTLKKHYQNLYCDTFELLNQKLNCLKQLIYLSKNIVREFNNSLD